MIDFEKYDNIDNKTKLVLYEKLLYMRLVSGAVQDAALKLEIKCPLHFSLGQEAASAGISPNLREDDFVFTTHRSHAPYLAKGGDLGAMIAEFYGKKMGSVGGVGGSMHLGSPEKNVFCTAIVGGGIPIAVGAALAFRFQNKDSVAAAFFGDGATEEGVFCESLNFASLKKLPVIFLCENNLYAVQSFINKTQANPKIFERAAAFGMPGVRIDGNNVLEVYVETQKAIELARRGGGPTLIEAVTYRWLEHVGPNFDHELGYRTKEEVDEWMVKCPLDNYQKFLLGKNILTREKIEELTSRIKKQISGAWKFMTQSDYPKLSDLELM